MLVNIQISRDRIGEIIRNYVENAVLRSPDLGLGGIQDIPFDFSSTNLNPSTEPGVVDHIDLGPISFEIGTGDRFRDNFSVNLPPARIPDPLIDPPYYIRTPSPVSETFQDVVALCNVQIFCIRQSDLESSGHGGLDPVAPERVVTFHGQVVVIIRQPTITGSNLSIALEPVGIKIGIPNPGDPSNPFTYVDATGIPGSPANQVLSAMQSHRREWFPPLSFSVGDISGTLEGGLSLWNAGLRLGEGVLDLQLQLEPSGYYIPVTESASTEWTVWELQWQGFPDSTAPNELGSLDWGVFFWQETIFDVIKSSVKSGLGGQPGLTVGQIASTWSVVDADGHPAAPGSAGSHARINTTIAVHSANPWPWGIDMNVHVRSDITLDGSDMRFDMQFSMEPQAGSLVLDAFTAAFFADILGPATGETLGTGLVDGLKAGFTLIAVAYLWPIPRLDSYDSTLHHVEGNHYYVSVPIPTTENEVLGTLRPAQCVARADGLLLGGSFTIWSTGLPPLPAGTADAYWARPEGASCPPEGESPALFAHVEFEFLFPLPAPNIPLVSWGQQVLARNPDTTYVPSTPPRALPVPVWGSLYESVGFNRARYGFSFTPEGLQAARNDVTDGLPSAKVLIQTNAGARIVTLPIPDNRITDADRERIAYDITFNCNLMRNADETMSRFSQHLHDMIRLPWPLPGPGTPPPINAVQWSVLFDGFAHGAVFELLADAGKRQRGLGKIGLDGKGRQQMDLWQTGELLKSEVTLQIAATQAKLPGTARLAVAARRYTKSAEAPVAGKVTDMALLESPRGVFAAVLTNERLTSLRAGAAQRLWATGTVFSAELEGVTALADVLLAWGKSGVWITSGESGWQRLSNQPAAGVALEGQRVVARGVDGKSHALEALDPPAPKLSGAHGFRLAPLMLATNVNLTHAPAKPAAPQLPRLETVGPTHAIAADRFALALSEKGDAVELLRLVDRSANGYFQS